jgi:hypothetical protein
LTYSKDHQDKAIQYSGQFKQGEPNGNGTFTWADGSTYIGHYENGFRSGYGVLYYNKEHPLEQCFSNWVSRHICVSPKTYNVSQEKNPKFINQKHLRKHCFSETFV